MNQPRSTSAFGEPTCVVPSVEQSQWFANEVHAHDSQLDSYLRGSFPAVREVEDVVKGQMTAAEVVGRLLEGTRPASAQDKKTGAFNISRRHDPDGLRAAPLMAGDRPGKQLKQIPSK